MIVWLLSNIWSHIFSFPISFGIISSHKQKTKWLMVIYSHPKFYNFKYGFYLSFGHTYLLWFYVAIFI
ncbi:hypothetical protein Hanom_Chr02g00155451 [Helianthus anomalus]